MALTAVRRVFLTLCTLQGLQIELWQGSVEAGFDVKSTIMNSSIVCYGQVESAVLDGIACYGQQRSAVLDGIACGGRIECDSRKS